MDKNGKSKCNVMHVGKHSIICPQLKVHGSPMHTVTHTKYLGDIVAADSRNDLNIKSRVAKGMGNITRVMNILEKVTLGSHYYKTAILLRESIFLSALLINSESWHGVTAENINQLESLDKLLLGKILKTPISTPTEAMYLELGILRIRTIVKARRINFLHYLLNRKETEMISQVFSVQWSRPDKNDWSILVKQDLSDFNLDANLSNIKRKSKWSFKNLVRIKAQEYEFNQLMKDKQKHTKLDNLWYSKLETQKYLELANLNKNEAQTIFKYRTRMAKFGENFRGNKSFVICPLCHTHPDSQKMSYENCPVLVKNIKIPGEYEDIFKTYIPKYVVQALMDIEKFRDEFLSQIEANSTRQHASWMGASDNVIYLNS